MYQKRRKIIGIILKTLLVSGALIVASQSPYFLYNVLKKCLKGDWGRTDKEKTKDVFYYLKRKGYIFVEKQGKQIYIHLTEKGKKVAGKYQIENLKIKSPKKWDKKWRVIIFDIEDKQRFRREAFRGKLINLGFYQLQKSVWTYPYDCQKEIVLLRDFFNLSKENIKVILAERIEDDQFIKKYFKLN